MSESSSELIRKKWNKQSRNDIINECIVEAMLRRFIMDGSNRMLVRSVFEERYNRKLKD